MVLDIQLREGIFYFYSFFTYWNLSQSVNCIHIHFLRAVKPVGLQLTGEIVYLPSAKALDHSAHVAVIQMTSMRAEKSPVRAGLECADHCCRTRKSRGTWERAACAEQQAFVWVLQTSLAYQCGMTRVMWNGWVHRRVGHPLEAGMFVHLRPLSNGRDKCSRWDLVSLWYYS